VTALVWGVKESFRNYVAGAGGEVETLDTAGRTADGAFVFPAAPGGTLRLDAGGGLQGEAAFSGEVLFQAHGGMLKVRLIGPTLRIDAEGAVLTVDEGGGARYPMAKLYLEAMTREAGAIVIPTRLTPDGSYWLGGNYAAMTLVDPVRLTLAD
jgi:hypothetical protein